MLSLKSLGKRQGSPYMMETTSKMKGGNIFGKIRDAGGIIQENSSAGHYFLLKEG